MERAATSAKKRGKIRKKRRSTKKISFPLQKRRDKKEAERKSFKKEKEKDETSQGFGMEMIAEDVRDVVTELMRKINE